jgi:hypothetical protein
MKKEISFDSGSFYINGSEVIDISVLENEIQSAKNMSAEFFRLYEGAVRRRKIRSRKNAETLSNRERLLISEANINIDLFNKFRWAKPVSIDEIRVLYESSASGILNTELLDEVGYGFWARCMQAKEERPVIKSHKVKCHNCCNILCSETDLFICGCGREYTYSAYKKSFADNKMPNGNAVPIFDEFIKQWMAAESSEKKLELIDGVIHQIHISLANNMTGRLTATQLIGGTKAQIKDLILGLAYGDDNVKDEFRYISSDLI